MSALRILQVSHRVPFPPVDGGSIGIYNITRGLSLAGHEVHALCINTPKHSQPADALRNIAHQHDVFVNTSISLFALIRNYFFRKDVPYNVERFLSSSVGAKIEELLQQHRFDVIHVEGSFVNFYIDLIRRHSDAPIVSRAHNIEYVIWDRLSHNQSNPFKRWYFGVLADRLREFERIHYDKADAIAAITVEDRQRLADLGVTAHTEVIPAGVMLDRFDGVVDVQVKKATLFILSAFDWIPNQEALFWFLENVWRELVVKQPGLELHVAGNNMPDSIRNIRMPNLVMHGFVPSAVDFIAQHDLMLVPLLAGGGMRIKIIEGMAAGKCILTTDVGAEGIACTDERDIVICRSPAEWIQKIIFYISHPEKKRRIGSMAKALAATKYDNRAVTVLYTGLYHRLIQERDKRKVVCEMPLRSTNRS